MRYNLNAVTVCDFYAENSNYLNRTMPIDCAEFIFSKANCGEITYEYEDLDNILYAKARCILSKESVKND